MFKSVRRLIGKAYDTAKVYGKRIIGQVGKLATQINNSFPPSIQNILTMCGQYPVTNIVVCRETVAKSTEDLLNKASKGEWEKAKKKYGYDHFFHLFMRFDVNGKTLHLEKNAIINLTYNTRTGEECMPVSGEVSSLNDLMERTRKQMGDRFFPYDAFKNNCQNFILNVLSANHLNTPELTKFVHQDIQTLTNELPEYVNPTANVFTGLAGLIDRGLQNTFIPIDGRQKEAPNYPTDAT
jgi:hypothetical protein